MKVDITQLVRGVLRTQSPDSISGEPTAMDRYRRKQEKERVLSTPGTRAWGDGVFSYAPVQGLLWQGDYGVNPPATSIAKLEGAGFHYRDGKCWRMLGTLNRRPSEISKRRISDFIDAFGFDFRVLASATS